MPTDADNKRQAARDVIDILEDISKILVCPLVRDAFVQSSCF